MKEECAMTPGKLWGGLIVLFLAGTLTGIGGTILYHQYVQEDQGERGPAARQERVMKRLTKELSLSPDQQAGIRPIVNRAHVELLQLRFQHQPAVEQVFAQGLVDIKATLSAGQQVKLDELYAQLQRRWQISRDYLEATKKEMRQPE
jgi:hypothetical protein